MFSYEQQEEERWKEADTYTASLRYWLHDVNYHNLDTFQNWQYLIENRVSRHMWLKTYLRWCHKLPNSKLIFQNCRFKAFFDALVYDLLSLKSVPPFLNVCTVWLHTLSQCIGGHNQLGSHIILHWRSYALGFCRKSKNYLKLRTRAPKSIAYNTTLRNYTLSQYIDGECTLSYYLAEVHAALLLC